MTSHGKRLKKAFIGQTIRMNQNVLPKEQRKIATEYQLVLGVETSLVALYTKAWLNDVNESLTNFITTLVQKIVQRYYDNNVRDFGLFLTIG